MASGISDITAGPIRIRSPVSRNLNSGDSIQMIFGIENAVTSTFMVHGLVEYAVTY